jgi:hypothetical protein
MGIGINCDDFRIVLPTEVPPPPTIEFKPPKVDDLIEKYLKEK